MRFLQAKKGDHNNPSLLDQFTPSMECQVNVRPANGEPVEGKRNTYTDGVRYWFNIRIPKDANTDSPFWDDYDIPFPLDEYGAEIGLSGWDWQAKVSRWVGFDFDDAMGHADGLADGQFNGELENCVLAHIDEHDLSRHDESVEKIKEWVTGLTISIRRMRTNQYTVPSYLHFVQCGNDPGHCKVLPKDCRIVVVRISKPQNPIKKEELQGLLLAEAPHFLRTLLDLTLPLPDGRIGRGRAGDRRQAISGARERTGQPVRGGEMQTRSKGEDHQGQPVSLLS